MIHILQSVSNMDRGGIESMLMNYYRHLDRTRFQFDFLVNKKKPGFFDDEIRALGGRIFQSPGVAPQSYPAYLRSMQQLLAQHPEIKVLHHAQTGRVHTLICRGSAEELEQQLAALHPIFIDAVPLSLEEIFIYELGGEDYAIRDIVL